MDLIFENIVLLITVLIVVLIAIGASVYMRNRFRRPTDYRSVFWIGVAWLPIGIASGNTTFVVLGIVFLIMGIRHRDKWEANRFRWSDLTKEEKRVKFYTLSAMFFVVLTGGLVYFLGA